MPGASKEQLLSLAKAARRESVHPHTIYRWHRPGLRGGRIKLRLLRRGGRLFVTPGALEAFYRELANDAEGRDVINGDAAGAAHAAADAFCRAEGL